MNFYDGLIFPAFGSNSRHHGSLKRRPLYYGLQYNHAGHFYLKINNGPEIRAEGPCAFITHPGAFFEYGYYDETTRDHNHICTHGKRINQYLASGLLVINDDSPIIKIRRPDAFLNTMIDIMNILRRNAPATPPRAVLLFEDLLLQLNHEPLYDNNFMPFHQQDFFSQLIYDIRENPSDNWCFEEISQKHGQTFRHFRRLFKSVAGLPPQQFLIQCRLKLAASMLVESTDPVNVIAEDSGFSSNIYFSRLFKQHYKITPLEYRREFSL